MTVKLPAGAAQRLLAVCVLSSLATVAAFRLLWVGPQRDLLAMRRMELEQGRADVVRARRAAGRLAGLEAEVERLRQRHAALGRFLPARHHASGLLRELQGLAAQAGLTMEAFTPEAALPGGQFEEWPVRLELTGGFHELVAFLHEVSRLPRIVIVGQLSIRALDSGTRAATIAVTCIATTYVPRPTAPDAAALEAGVGAGR